VVEEADSVAAARSLQDIAVLVDVELPDGGGIALTPELAALAWHPRVEERHGANSPRLPYTTPWLARLVCLFVCAAGAVLVRGHLAEAASARAGLGGMSVVA
jgi:hypothetical protein